MVWEWVVRAETWWKWRQIDIGSHWNSSYGHFPSYSIQKSYIWGPYGPKWGPSYRRWKVLSKQNIRVGGLPHPHTPWHLSWGAPPPTPSKKSAFGLQGPQRADWPQTVGCPCPSPEMTHIWVSREMTPIRVIREMTHI